MAENHPPKYTVVLVAATPSVSPLTLIARLESVMPLVEPSAGRLKIATWLRVTAACPGIVTDVNVPTTISLVPSGVTASSLILALKLGAKVGSSTPVVRL